MIDVATILEGKHGERFWGKVLKTNACWVWIGSIDSYGYGQFSRYGKLHLAHRITYFHRYGETSKELDHLCRNPGCVNPEHLEAVTHAENMLRSSTTSRRTHCFRGHAFTPISTGLYVHPGGKKVRYCRICKVAGAKLLRDRKKVIGT